MKIVVWLTEGTWEACVDAARDQPAAAIDLLHVIDPENLDAIAGARAGLLGRGLPSTLTTAAAELTAAQNALLDAAQTRLGAPANRQARWGRAEREVITACADAGLLILARDGGHTRLGPRSIGHAARFVLDHAPCRVLLLWPDEPPNLATLPPTPPLGIDRHRHLTALNHFTADATVAVGDRHGGTSRPVLVRGERTISHLNCARSRAAIGALIDRAAGPATLAVAHGVPALVARPGRGSLWGPRPTAGVWSAASGLGAAS